jgi:hypothetical protein
MNARSYCPFCLKYIFIVKNRYDALARGKARLPYPQSTTINWFISKRQLYIDIDERARKRSNTLGRKHDKRKNM